MRPEDYAWNEFERIAYKTKMNHLPSPYKVAIWDDSEKRLELEQILDRLPQKELADIIHYTVAIAAINHIDLTKTIFEKDKIAAIKYQHERDLEGFLKGYES